MKNRKFISIVLMVVFVLTVFTPMIANVDRSVPLTQSQLNSIAGGMPVLNIVACTALLAECLASTDGWWADILCMGLTAGCLAL